MKCRICGEETDPEKTCARCGEPTPSAGMEVRYEDFKISELLDIKMKQNDSRGGKGGKTKRPEARNRMLFRKASRAEGKSSHAMKIFVLITFMTGLAALAVYLLLSYPF